MFHDRLDEAVTALDDGQTVDLRSVLHRWRIRIRAGWPGVEGPGSFAYHLQLGGDRDGDLAPWASTPYAQNLGFAATRIAGAIAAFGLESDATGLANPTMIASGSIGGLEVADLSVELLREALGVRDIDQVQIVGDKTTETATAATGAPALPCQRTDSDTWYSELGFHPEPTVSPDGDHVVGWIDHVLVEVSRDLGSLPGLTVIVARARLTDPDTEPLTIPSAAALSLLQRMRGAGADEVTVEPVTARCQLVHAWAHLMLLVGPDDPSNGSGPAQEHGSGAIDGNGSGRDPVADAAARVVRFVRDARRNDPDVVRPTRMVIRLGD